MLSCKTFLEIFAVAVALSTYTDNAARAHAAECEMTHGENTVPVETNPASTTPFVPNIAADTASSTVASVEGTVAESPIATGGNDATLSKNGIPPSSVADQPVPQPESPVAFGGNDATNPKHGTPPSSNELGVVSDATPSPTNVDQSVTQNEGSNDDEKDVVPPPVVDQSVSQPGSPVVDDSVPQPGSPAATGGNDATLSKNGIPPSSVADQPVPQPESPIATGGNDATKPKDGTPPSSNEPGVISGATPSPTNVDQSVTQNEGSNDDEKDVVPPPVVDQSVSQPGSPVVDQSVPQPGSPVATGGNDATKPKDGIPPSSIADQPVPQPKSESPLLLVPKDGTPPSSNEPIINPGATPCPTNVDQFVTQNEGSNDDKKDVVPPPVVDQSVSQPGSPVVDQSVPQPGSPVATGGNDATKPKDGTPPLSNVDQPAPQPKSESPIATGGNDATKPKDGTPPSSNEPIINPGATPCPTNVDQSVTQNEGSNDDKKDVVPPSNVDQSVSQPGSPVVDQSVPQPGSPVATGGNDATLPKDGTPPLSNVDQSAPQPKSESPTATGGNDATKPKHGTPPSSNEPGVISGATPSPTNVDQSVTQNEGSNDNEKDVVPPPVVDQSVSQPGSPVVDQSVPQPGSPVATGGNDATLPKDGTPPLSNVDQPAPQPKSESPIATGGNDATKPKDGTPPSSNEPIINPGATPCPSNVDQSVTQHEGSNEDVKADAFPSPKKSNDNDSDDSVETPCSSNSESDDEASNVNKHVTSNPAKEIAGVNDVTNSSKDNSKAEQKGPVDAGGNVNGPNNEKDVASSADKSKDTPEANRDIAPKGATFGSMAGINDGNAQVSTAAAYKKFLRRLRINI
ncbi:hypothetical protein CCR75_006468 [Bremia lactucae]|uniref:Uncharacterized protein n=1 Tax=Bremia lactucae TaxID=4779 RepID=A0A976IH94_BRELC|nr:hypothetical protein CCR75_006468 [Bremia lactucae]